MKKQKKLLKLLFPRKRVLNFFKKIIPFLIIPFLFLGCVRCNTLYRQSSEDVISNEINSINVFINSAKYKGDKDNLNISIEKNRNDKNNSISSIIKGSMKVKPFYEDPLDSIEFLISKEGLLIFGGEKFQNQWKSKDVLNVLITYNIDSSCQIYEKEVLLVLYKDTDCGFSIH